MLVRTPRFSDTVHSREPVCEVGGGYSIVKEWLVSYFCVIFEWEIPFQECPNNCAWAECGLCVGLYIDLCV